MVNAGFSDDARTMSGLSPVARMRQAEMRAEESAQQHRRKSGNR